MAGSPRVFARVIPPLAIPFRPVGRVIRSANGAGRHVFGPLVAKNRTELTGTFFLQAGSENPHGADRHVSGRLARKSARS
jgi:hypothetical protein